MEFFDSLIDETLKILIKENGKTLAFAPDDCWCDAGVNQVILQRDTFAELDGVGFNLVTSRKLTDSVTVIGNDISGIKEGRKYARIALIEFDDSVTDENAHSLIKKAEYVKYHCFPDGFMMRSTSRTHKESVRISNKAEKEGISFFKVGNLFIKKYKEMPNIKAVSLYFLTDSSAEYNELEKIAQKNNDIVKTLDHIMNSVNFDCSICTLKPICDEIEGMKNLHFKKN